MVGRLSRVPRQDHTADARSHGGARMSIGGPDWLVLTPEPTLEPELPICDPHHHLWDFRPEPVPYQRYLLPELTTDLHSGHRFPGGSCLPHIQQRV
jgi:hypothetical protein